MNRPMLRAQRLLGRKWNSDAGLLAGCRTLLPGLLGRSGTLLPGLVGRSGTLLPGLVGRSGNTVARASG